MVLGPMAATAEAERKRAYTDYVRRRDYELSRTNDAREHEALRQRMAELDARLGEIERSVSASEAEVNMYARTLSSAGREEH